RAARGAREGGAVRGGPVRGDRPRDGVRGALHAPRRTRAADPRDAARADVGRPRADLRARPAAGCGGGARESRPARLRARVDGRRAALPFALRQLLAPRLDAQGSGADDARRRGGGTRMSYLALADGTVWHGESVAAEGEALERAAQPPSMLGRALVKDVSTDEPYVYEAEGRVRIGVVDYGVKNSVLRRLAKAGAAVTVHPHDTDASELAGYDGVLLSPGPGDPEPLAAETETVRQLLGRTHVLGICLGHQLIARAAGHDTYKLPFGHRGANHPVHERLSGRVLVTSQIHGFAVRPSQASEV